MNEHKGVNATRLSIRRDCRRAIGAERHLVANCEVGRYKRSQDTGCQVEARDGVICTCRAKAKRHETRYFSIQPEQVYTYHGVRSYTNIGVGDVKTIHRRKVRKIYLPAMDDREVRSSEVPSVIIRKHSNTADSSYVPKTTSSKCVGGFWQPVVNVLSEKLSAVVKCLYATTGLEVAPPNQKMNKEIGNNTEHKKFATTTTQVECELKVRPERSDRSLNTKEQREIPNDKFEISPNTGAYLERKEEDKFSSESLVQHLHDLDHSRSVSQEDNTKVSLQPMEKKVEKQHRQMIASTKSKNQSVIKNKSLLRRRFEALRRGHKKADAKKKDVDTVSSSPASIGHKAIKDVSMVFDLPFLEAESNYDAKPHAPANPPKYDRASFRQTVTGEKKCLVSTNDEENEFEQAVSGPDKNLEEDTRTETKISSDATKDKIYDKTISDYKDADKKTGGMKFSFFKKRSKDKAKSEKTYKTKKGFPANCCEVKFGSVHKTSTNSDAYNTLTPNSNADDTDNHEDMQRKAWLRKFLTSNINSRDSVKIRWNNKTYATSSSTVFRIVDNFYKETGIVIRSKSDIQMNKSTYKSSGKRGNFVNQHIEAWMVPKTITDMPTFITMNIFSTAQKEDKTEKEKGISKQKRSIDKAKIFSLNMKEKVVLHSNHKVQDDDEKTSNFLRIDIPDYYVSESCDEENRGMSEEKVYNIVEYETLKSNSEYKKKSNFDTGDHADNDNRVSVDKKDSQEIESRVSETVIKSPSIHKDVVVEDSNVDFPKRCDVIEVGVLTQKDVIDFKPILKLEDDLSEYESSSNHFNPTGCEFAQSYLQEYYSQWMPLDEVQSSSNTKLIQRDGSKSCPNVCEEYHPSTLISPSHSSCSHCHNLFDDEYRNKILYGYVTSLVKSSKCKEAKTDPATTVDKQTEVKKGDTDSKKKKEKKDNKDNKDIRVLPKDSLQVFKRRQLYAMSNKSRWLCPDKAPCPVLGSAEQGNLCEKRVSMVDDGSNPCPGNKLLEGIITYKGAACKTDQPKKILKLGFPCEIPQIDPPCKNTCEKMKKAPCDKNTEPCPTSLVPTSPSQTPPPSDQNTEPCPPKPPPILQGEIPPPDPACKKKCEKMKKPPCDQNTEPCPPKPPPIPQCEIPPPEPECKKNCEKMKNPPCDKNTETLPPPTTQCEIPPSEPACKKNCEKMKNPPCYACSDPPSPPCSSETNSSSNSSEPKINYNLTIEESCNKHTVKGPKSHDPAYLKNGEKMKNPSCDMNSEPCPPSAPPVPLCNLCMKHSPSEPGCDKNCEKIKKSRNKSKKARSEPPCPAEYNALTYQFSERSINCMISFEEPAAYDTCIIKLKMAAQCERPSPLDSACQKKGNKMKKPPYEKRSQPRPPPSPPSESPSHSESDSDSSKSSERNSDCIVTFDASTSYDTCKILRMKCPKHPDSSCQKRNSMPCLPSPGSESPCPSERNAPASQFPERSTHCMMSYEEPTGYDTSKTPPKCSKPFILGSKYDVIVVPPDSAYQENYEKTNKPPKDKKFRLPPPSPPSESPCQSQCNASPSQFSERSTNCMMSFEESSDDDKSNNLEEWTEYDTSKNPQETGYKTYEVRPKHDMIAEAPYRAFQEKYEKAKRPPNYKKSKPYYQSPPSGSPCQSESPSQFSDRSINCSMSFEESTGYDCYDTSQNPPEKSAKPYKLAPKHDLIADPPDPTYQTVFDKIEKLRNKTLKPSPPSPSPPSESPCPSECNEPAPQFSDRSINCMMSYEELSEDDLTKNLEESPDYDTSKYPPQTVTKPYKVGPKYDIVFTPPHSEYQKKYEINKKPPKEKKLRLPPPSPPSESPCHSEWDEPASQFSERSINCMMSFEESAGHDTSENPPEQGTKPYKLSPKYDIVVIPPNSEYERKNEKTKKPSEEDKKSKASPPDGSPRSSKNSADSRFSECNTNCMISYEGCHKPMKMGPQYDVVVIPPDSANQKKSDKTNKPPSDESAMPSSASPKQASKFPTKSSAASLISDCMITYHDIPGFSTCNMPPTKCAKPQKKCNTIKPTCDKSRMPCPRSPLASPCPSRSNSVCSVLSACTSPPPCPVPKCPTASSHCKESCPEVRLTCPSPNDSFCVKKYPSKMQPLLGCKVRPPPKCSRYPLPSCSPPPMCKKYPPPGCLPPPKCTKYPPPSCSPPPKCKKYPPPSCSPPPTCKKYPPPSCSSPPTCNKYPPPSCSPPSMCNKYPPPSCSSPPMCNKYPPPGCFPPPKCNKYPPPGCFPPPKCNKYPPPGCFPPPKCNKYPPPGCFPPPKCNKYPPPGCFPPPKCTKLPGCFKPPKCQKYIKTDCMGNKKISCKPTSEKGCDPFRKCGSQMFPPPSPCPRPMSKRCVLPPRPCRFPPHLCRPHSAPICPTMERRTPCLNDPGPCRLCAESYPCPVSPIPLCPSKLADCFKCPKEGLFLKKLPCPKKACIQEFPCKKPFDVCSPKKPCVKTTFVEDGSGRNPNYSCSLPSPKPCLAECPIRRAVDMFEPCTDEIGWIKLIQKNKVRGKKNKSFVESCSGPNTVDEERVPHRKQTTIKNKCTNKKAPIKTMTFIDKCPARVDEARSVHSRLLGDMYQPSFCQRVSTKDAQIVNSLPKVNSQSLDNLVEIQLNMKIIQNDKITEISFGKDGEEKEIKMLKSSCKNDYVVNNTTTSLREQVASTDMTNGVNIHIVINNFKRKDKKPNLTAETDHDEERSKFHNDFTNKICQEFHTVSTAYSDGIQSDVNQKDISSAERAAWNMTGSSEKSKTEPSGDVSDLSHNKDIKKFTASQNVTSVTALVNKCSSQKVGDAKSTGAEVKEEEEKEIAKVIYNADELHRKPSTYKSGLFNNTSSDNLKNALNHGEKKNSLNTVVEKAGKVLQKNKNKVSKLTKLFKAIVKTSESSENAEMTVTDNDLTEDKALASFKPNFFRNTDSMNNYYKLSCMTSDYEDCCYKHNTSINRENKCGSGTCVCTTFAAKLNVLGPGGCPCSSPVKNYVDIETNCDIGTGKDVSHVLSNSPSDYLDAATQRSRLFISRANSADVSNNNITVKDNNVLSNIESKQINPGTYISSHHTKVKSFCVNISPVVNQIGIEKECNMRKFHRETISNISNEDKILANMKPKRDGIQREEIIPHMEPMRIRVETTEESAEEYFKEKSIKANAPADVLQSYETKKAVLEIYTERMVCDGRKHLVAKLPKFTIERESDFIKYEKICKRSFVMSFES